MLSRQDAEHLLFIHGLSSMRPCKKVPLSWYRLCDVMPATIADSHMVVNRILAELKHEEQGGFAATKGVKPWSWRGEESP